MLRYWIMDRLKKKGWFWHPIRERYELPCRFTSSLASVVIEEKDYGTIGSFFTDIHARWVRFWLTH